MSREKPRLKEIGFKPNYGTKAQKLMLLLKMLKKCPKLLKLQFHFKFLPVVLFQDIQIFLKRRNG
jgi:hypothetical protein